VGIQGKCKNKIKPNSKRQRQIDIFGTLLKEMFLADNSAACLSGTAVGKGTLS